MKQIKVFGMFFLLMALPLILNSAMNCECGTHSEGIVAYSVNGNRCCHSAPNPTGYVHNYVQGDDGVWQHTGSSLISGGVAQSRCCDPV